MEFDAKVGVKDSESSSTSPNLDEPGSSIWHPYLNLADKYDVDLVEGWRDDMDALLIFAALFSAIVTSFVIESYQFLQEDPAETTINILLQISQQLAVGTAADVAMRPPPFQAAVSDVAVNVFWFLSLAFSLACSLAAVMVRQWARQYLQKPRSLSSSSERARMRQQLFESVASWRLELIIELIPILLHIALFLFFVGLLLFLRGVNHQLALFILVFSAIGGFAYVAITFLPILNTGCPYTTPFTTLHSPVLRVSQSIIGSLAAVVSVALWWLVANRVSRVWLPARDVQSPAWAFARVSHMMNAMLSAPRWLVSRLHASHTSSDTIRLEYFVEDPHVKKSVAESTLAKPYLSGHDIRALRWAMELSKRRNDLLQIIEGIPDFVRTLAEDYIFAGGSEMGLYAAQSHLQQTGIVSRILPLLDSCISRERVQPSMRRVALSSIEALHWLMRCPAAPTLDHTDSPPPLKLFQIGMPRTYFAVHNLQPVEQLLPTLTDPDDPLSLLWKCTLLSVVLDQIYQVEKLIRYHWQRVEHAWYEQARGILSEVEGIVVELRWMYYRTGLAGSDANPVMRVNIPVLPPTWPLLPADAATTLAALCTCRGEWAAWILTHAEDATSNSRPSIPPDALFTVLFDAATHLAPFPATPVTTQVDVFRLLDSVMRAQENPHMCAAHSVVPASLKVAYASVLFDDLQVIAYPSRWLVHADFLTRLNIRGFRERPLVVSAVDDADLVYKPQQQQPSSFPSSQVHINFRDYCAVLDSLASTLLGLSKSALGTEDAFADAIHSFIECRILDADGCDREPVVASSDHISTARLLLSTLPDNRQNSCLRDVINDTALQFAYASRL